MYFRKFRNHVYEFCRFEDGEGEGEVAFFSAKRWDRRNRADLIESATPCHDAQVMGLYRDSNPLRLTVLAAMSEDYTTALQHLQCKVYSGFFGCDKNFDKATHLPELRLKTDPNVGISCEKPTFMSGTSSIT